MFPLLVAAVGCTSASAYTHGPLAIAAWPAPSLRLTRTVPGLAADVPAGSVDIEGTLTRLQPAGDPSQGFRAEVRRPDRIAATIEVRSGLEPLPDVRVGSAVRLKVRTGNETEVLLSDAAGAAFYLFTGPTPPTDQRLLPVQVRPTAQRAYVEVRTSEDLCQWNWVRTHLSFNLGGTLATLAPGETALVRREGRNWWLAALDARTPEESTCDTEGEPRVTYAWTRVSAAVADRLAKKEP